MHRAGVGRRLQRWAFPADMGLLSSLAQAVRRLDETVLSVAPRLSVPALLRPLLEQSPLVIADIGAAGGVEPRWRSLRGLTCFLTFEPRPGEASGSAEGRNFPVCLGAEPGRRTLRVSRHAQSSSLYPFNEERLNDFAVHDCFTVVSTMELDVDTLDRCVARAPDRSPDYLKIDVEGAEVDVLQGALQTLQTSVLGARVEVNFVRRHLGGATFCEVDAFLAARGLELFQLTREQMIRRNLLHGPLSQPQLVWGDALYLLTRTAFLRRLEAAAPEQRALLLTKFTVLLLAYRVHDYALELVRQAGDSGLVCDPVVTALTTWIRTAARVTVGDWTRLLVGAWLASVVCLLALPVASARQMALPYFKRRLGYLLHSLWRRTARGGEANASVSDCPS